MAESGSGMITLSIVTPTALVAETDTESVILSGEEGDFGVLPGHSPFLTTLRPGVVFYEEGGMPRRIFIAGGFVEATENKVVVLASSTLVADDIDLAAAREAVAEAEKALAALPQDSDERPKAAKVVEEAAAILSLATGDADVY
jgi:F-type H+-transporting ATPase subunit epsilon